MTLKKNVVKLTTLLSLRNNLYQKYIKAEKIITFEQDACPFFLMKIKINSSVEITR